MSEQIIYQVAAKPLNPLQKLTVTVTAQHVVFERGMLGTETQQVPMAHVFDVDVKQTMVQKSRGVGTLTVHVNRPGGERETVVLEDIPQPSELARCLNDIAPRARHAESQIQNTHYYQGGGHPMHVPTPPPAPAPAPATAAPSADDIMSQLERLGKLRDAGVVSEEEFAAKKAEMLARL